MDYVKNKLDSLFEYVRETFDLGDKIRFITKDGEDVIISKDEFTEAEADYCINGCFIGDTLIRTKEGLKRIDSIEDGDLVLSKNIKTGEISYKPVLYVYKKHTSNFVNITIEGKLIETTPTHIFMLDDGDWRAAENLQIGNKITASDGYDKTIESIELIQYNECREIYNLNVDENHTYFVSDLGVLVHNDCNYEGVSKTNATEPSLEKGGKPKGNYAREKERGLKKQNETANLLAEEGYDITMLDEVNGGNGYGIKTTSNPDYIIENEVFDCYSPNPDTSIDNITRTITKKTKTQAERIVLNLDDYPAEEIQKVYDAILRKTNENGDLKNLKELLVVMDGKITRLFVR
ncbi:polymorphic toxin-type HINT domain-containing protein [Clostridium sp.]|uniref:polymorphic toxin-type HINT domain-containing protein n=1 Tax=Clostridium sp. TaxID=1506 RepID=UPI00262D24C3|nr:polymorphic toxin-type HINT domain-containing protein [Clostridium sp.]